MSEAIDWLFARPNRYSAAWACAYAVALAVCAAAGALAWWSVPLGAALAFCGIRGCIAVFDRLVARFVHEREGRDG